MMLTPSTLACPAVRVLGEGDILLARDGRRIERPNSRCGLQLDEEGRGSAFPISAALKRYEAEGLRPRCDVRTWNSGEELRTLIGAILDGT